MGLPWREKSYKIPAAYASPPFPPLSFKDINSLLLEKNPPALQRSISASAAIRFFCPLTPPPLSDRFSNKKHILLYFTSLRVVRRTFDDCSTVRSLLRCFRVAVDERDLSIDSRFHSELKEILGGTKQRRLILPQLFIAGHHIGGADEIWRLHETGELKKLVAGLAPAASTTACRHCGGLRFVLCSSCNGSHKCSNEKGDGLRICRACNENGLARCPDCLLGS